MDRVRSAIAQWHRLIARARSSPDSGGAIVEFLGVSVLLLVPLVYLIVTFARIQAGAYAAELAARESARSAAVAGVEALEGGARVAVAVAVADTRAQAVTGIAAEDFGFNPDQDVELHLACSSNPCFAPGSDVQAEVTITVALPGVPAFVRDWIPLEVTVTAEANSPVDGFASSP